MREPNTSTVNESPSVAFSICLSSRILDTAVSAIMRVYLLIATLLAALCSASKLCGTNKFPGVNNAIGKFCQNKKLMVPSKYSLTGMRGNSGKGQVWITGKLQCVHRATWAFN